MKKLTIIALLLFSGIINAQFKFGTKEYFTFSVCIDPSATIKEESPNLVAELEYVHSFMYIKATTQILPDLQGGYFDYGGAIGLNTTVGLYENFRIYGGGRLGIIKRSGLGYPLAGIEGGINYNLTEKFFIGIRATSDYRTDFKFSGANPQMRNSGFLRMGVNF